MKFYKSDRDGKIYVKYDGEWYVRGDNNIWHQTLLPSSIVALEDDEDFKADFEKFIYSN